MTGGKLNHRTVKREKCRNHHFMQQTVAFNCHIQYEASWRVENEKLAQSMQNAFLMLHHVSFHDDNSLCGPCALSSLFLSVRCTFRIWWWLSKLRNETVWLSRESVTALQQQFHLLFSYHCITMMMVLDVIKLSLWWMFTMQIAIITVNCKPVSSLTITVVGWWDGGDNLSVSDD